jgi:hypothetical protein
MGKSMKRNGEPGRTRTCDPLLLGDEDLQDLLSLLMGKPSDKVWIGKPLVTIN